MRSLPKQLKMLVNCFVYQYEALPIGEPGSAAILLWGEIRPPKGVAKAP